MCDGLRSRPRASIADECILPIYFGTPTGQDFGKSEDGGYDEELVRG